MINNQTVVKIVIIIGIVILVAFAVNSVDFWGNREIVENEQGCNNITCEEAFDIYLQNKALFIDARYGEFYNAERIPGAINLPYHQRKNWNIVLKNVDQHQLLIVYCDSHICGLAERLCAYLASVGFLNIYHLSGGIDRWKDTGFPVIAHP